MGKLDNLQPKEVFRFFEEICNIPHGSYNLQQISDYLVKFAKDRNLEVIQDQELNVIIKKGGSKGYEDREPVILQGHMDMVAVKDDNIDKDMKTEGLDVETDGEYVWAKGTSLGGDDGIAVAYALALLDSDTIPHPPLEVVITTNEETGMEGARAVDLSGLKGRMLINMDNEEEGVLLTSCAGGARFNVHQPVNRIDRSGDHYRIEISGLQGGHSGEMIIKERGNSNVLMARTLLELSKAASLSVLSLEGGVADNAIPLYSVSEIVTDADEAVVMDTIKATERNIKGELEIKDPGFKLTVTKVDKGTFGCLDAESAKKVLRVIYSMPNGVQAMSFSVEKLVETSLNLGIMKLEASQLNLGYSVRSSVDSAKEALLDKMRCIAEGFDVKYEVTSEYPGWKFNPDSKLREHMVEVYRKLYGKDPEIVAIHAGVECGLLIEKVPGLDCISLGPDMKDIHTTGEKLSVASTKRVWDYVTEVLA